MPARMRLSTIRPSALAHALQCRHEEGNARKRFKEPFLGETAADKLRIDRARQPLLAAEIGALAAGKPQVGIGDQFSFSAEVFVFEQKTFLPAEARKHSVQFVFQKQNLTAQKIVPDELFRTRNAVSLPMTDARAFASTICPMSSAMRSNFGYAYSNTF